MSQSIQSVAAQNDQKWIEVIKQIILEIQSGKNQTADRSAAIYHLRIAAFFLDEDRKALE